MKDVVSTLFREMYFSHDGKIVTIDLIYFVKPYHRTTPHHQTSLNVLHVLLVPSPSPFISLASKHHDEVQ